MLPTRLCKAPVGILLVMLSYAAFGQNLRNRTVLGQVHAQQQVNQAVKDTAKLAFHNRLLPTQATAVCVAEPILFGIYGKRNFRKWVKGLPYVAALAEVETKVSRRPSRLYQFQAAAYEAFRQATQLTPY